MAQFPELSGRNILITGGANGIGAAMVRAFRDQGGRVFFCDTDRAAGQALAAEPGGEVNFAKVDLANESQIVRWIERLGQRCGEIHAVINNAACDPRIALDETTAAAWDSLFACNLRAYFLVSRESIKWMRAGAAIINFSSVTVHNGPANMTAYVATKAGIQGFTRSLARELGARRIRVNTLSPGWVMTERQLREYVTASEKRLIRSRQCIPDLIQPGEIASVALFLTSDGSRAITGQEVLVDRGWAYS